MQLHRRVFGLISGLHDYICKGTRDFKQSLSSIQDYNLTKILAKKCSFPDLQGDVKQNKVQSFVLKSIASDLQVYNFVDCLIRRNKANTLAEYVSKMEQFDSKGGHAVPEGIHGDVEGLGPDGHSLLRDPQDFINNYWINHAVRSFTNVESRLA